MPSLSAARRASLLSSIEQHPREPERNASRLRLSAMCTPTTSWPASTARAAATAESTPPDRAASTRMGIPLTLGPHHGNHGIVPCYYRLMRKVAPALSPLFRSQLQGQLLATVMAHPEREWSISDLASELDAPVTSVHDEVS